VVKGWIQPAGMCRDQKRQIQHAGMCHGENEIFNRSGECVVVKNVRLCMPGDSSKQFVRKEADFF
jgi:hypothetical protein